MARRKVANRVRELERAARTAYYLLVYMHGGAVAKAMAQLREVLGEEEAEARKPCP